jgi:hypothetical protein
MGLVDFACADLAIKATNTGRGSPAWRLIPEDST